MKKSEIRTLLKRCNFKGPSNYYHLNTTPNCRTVLSRYNSRNFVKRLGATGIFQDHLYNVDFENSIVMISRLNGDRYVITHSNIPLDYFLEFCKTKILGTKHDDFAINQREFFSKYAVF